MTYQIGVIGAGGWGTTLANLLAEKGNDVVLWAYEESTAKAINETHENVQYLPKVKLSKNLIAKTDLEDLVPDADILISAVPSEFVRTTANRLSGILRKDKQYKLVSVSKGLEHETFLLMTQVLREVLPENVKIAALSGPNHAEEVSRKMPTATVIATLHSDILEELTNLFATSYLKTYGLTDEYGVEICGAAKNITAIAIGICDGLNLGDNAKASIMTLGLTEMYRVGKRFGCTRKTFFGIAGVGDLIATCTSQHSRNRFYGERLAEGKSLEQITEELHGMVAEGVKTVRSVYHFAIKNKIYLPLTTQIYNVLYENKEMSEAVKDLLKLI